MRSRRNVWLAVFVAILAARADGALGQEPPATVIPPARAGLESVEFPGLEALETAVVEHLREARHAFEQAIAKGSTRDIAAAYGALGRVFHAYELFDAAETCYLNATRLNSGDAASLHLLGYLYQQSGRFDNAVDKYLGARRINPTDYAATMHLGDVYLALGRIRDARLEFESQRERFPAAVSAGLGEAALRDGRYREAISYLEAALRRIPGANALEYPLGMAYRGLGRLDEARAHLARRGSNGVHVADEIADSLQTLVRGERAFVLQGRHAYEAGQWQQAIELFRKAIAAAPSSAAARLNLGLALAQAGDALGAIEQFRAAFQAAPDDAQVSSALIRALMNASREDEAVEVYASAHAFPVDDESAVLKLSLALAAHERYRDAASLLEQGNRAYPERRPTATTLARLLAASPDLSLRDGQRALDMARAVYDSEATPAYAETVALALAELGRCDEAADWMRRAISQAESIKDTAEAARLRNEAPRYARRPCRQ